MISRQAPLEAFLRLISVGAFVYLAAILVIVQPRVAATTQPRVNEVASARSGMALEQPAAVKAVTVPDMPYALTVLELRAGPGDNYVVVGLVPRLATLEVLGRDTTGKWLAVPLLDQKLNGWVPVEGVGGPLDLRALPIAGQTPLR